MSDRWLALPFAIILATSLPARAQEVHSHGLPVDHVDPDPPVPTTDLVVTVEAGRIVLRWTGVSGTAGSTGTPLGYWVYASPEPTFFPPDPPYALWETCPAPQPAGTPLEMTANDSELPAATFLHFIVYTEGYGHLFSPSNIVAITTPEVFNDAFPPAAITDLALLEAGTTTLTLGWTAPTDDGGSGIRGYDLRWRKEEDGPVTSQTWSDPATKSQYRESSQGPAMIAGLDPGQGYFIAIRAIDGGGNAGDASDGELLARTLTRVAAGSGNGGSTAGCGASAAVAASPAGLWIAAILGVLMAALNAKSLRGDGHRVVVAPCPPGLRISPEFPGPAAN